MASIAEEVVDPHQGGDGPSAKSKIMERVGYRLPVMDAGVVRMRQTKRYYPTQQSYVDGDVINFIISSQGQMIDPNNSYLEGTFKLTENGAFPDASKTWLIPTLPAGLQGMFDSVVTTGWGDVPIEELPNYNIVGAFRDRAYLSRKDINAWGGPEGWSQEVVRSGPSLEFGDYGQGNAATLEKQARMRLCYGGAAALVRGFRFQMRPRHSGIWGGTKFIPLKQLGQLNLNMRLARVQDFVRMVAIENVTPELVDNAAWDKDAWILVRNGSYRDEGIDPHVEGVLNCYSGFTITNLTYVMEVVTPSASLDASITTLQQSSGIPLSVNSWKIIRKSVQGSPSQETYYFPPSLANISTVQVYHLPRSDCHKALGASQFLSYSQGAYWWQWTHGADSYPLNPVEDHLRGWRESVKALPFAGTGKQPNIPLYKYSWYVNPPLAAANIRASNFSSEADMDALCADIAPKYSTDGSSLYAAQDRTLHPDHFFIGLSLETLPGIKMSGKSTNEGAQLSLTVRYRTNADVTKRAANECFDQPFDMFAVINYQRICLAVADMKYAVRE